MEEKHKRNEAWIVFGFYLSRIGNGENWLLRVQSLQRDNFILLLRFQMIIILFLVVSHFHIKLIFKTYGF
jgi:hypothetical protein